MEKTDFKQFCDAWAITQEIGANGKIYSKGAMVSIFEAFDSFSFDIVNSAIKAHGLKNKFAPTQADILAILGSGNQQHLGADEAWAIALASMDEAETVVMTDEIMQALAIAWEVYSDGDGVGARMAFRSAYERIMQGAGKPVWRVTLGHDPGRREEAVRKAVEQGLLPKTEIAKYRLEKPVGTFKQLAIAATEKAKQIEPDKSDEILRNLRELKAMLKPAEDPATVRERERFEFEEHRKAELARVEEKLKADSLH
jgi:hypothetical protein